MFGENVRFKCNYAALRKSSDNQQKKHVNANVNKKEDTGIVE